MADSVGMADLRKENVERIVKGFALQKYVMKQLTMINNSNSWQESYYQETAADLSASGTRNVKGVARLAKFPYGEVNWTKKSAYLQKYGMEGVISWEDVATNNIDVVARTLLRIARAVAKSVDTEVFDVISENQTPSTINTVAIGAGDEWDSATVANRDPIQDILNAKKEISIDNYDIDNGEGYLVLSPTDLANALGNEKFQRLYKEEIAGNGNVGRVLGLKVITSNTVTNDFAMVVLAKECATWKSARDLAVTVIEDPGIKWTIRAWEVGVTQLTNPEAVCLITNTQA